MFEMHGNDTQTDSRLVVLKEDISDTQWQAGRGRGVRHEVRAALIAVTLCTATAVALSAW